MRKSRDSAPARAVLPENRACFRPARPFSAAVEKRLPSCYISKPIMKRIESVLVNKEETLFNLFKLKSMVRENDSIAVLMYGAPDPDAVASALALCEILRKTTSIAKCAFVSTEKATRQQNAEFIRAMKLKISLLKEVDLHQYRLVAVVDAQPTFFGDLLGDIKPQIVLDHHPCTTVWHAELADIRPRYGAVSTMMTEYLLAARIRIPKFLYTALLYGIKTDTDNFARDASLEDISAYYLNYARANRELIHRIELNEIPRTYLKYFDYAYRRRIRHRDRVISFLGKVESADACVQVADFYLRLIDISFVIIAAIVKDKLVIVFRSDGYRRDCGAIAERAFGEVGKAGGHRSAARVEIPMETLEGLIGKEPSDEKIESFIVDRLHRRRTHDDG